MKLIVPMLVLLISALSVTAQVRMPVIFGDHMIIQRSQKVPVWGWSSPNEKIVIEFRKQRKTTTAGKNGKWRIDLDPEPAGGPDDLSIRSQNQVVLHDVLVGEVWLCSGQSNMEFELKSVNKSQSEIAEANFPEIRQIKIPNVVSSSAKEDIGPATWDICSPRTAGNFTAVGYFFARELEKRIHVPVGLINSTWGGTMVETWTSRGALEKSPEFKSMMATLPEKDFEPLIKERRKNLERHIANIQKNISDTIPESEWKYPTYNSQTWPKISINQIWENQQLGLNDLDGIVWYRKEIVVNENTAGRTVTLSMGKIDDNDSTFVNGTLVGTTGNWSENRTYIIPAGTFLAGKNVIAVRVEDTGGGGGFYGDSSTVLLKSADGIQLLSDNWSFRIAKIYGQSAGISPNDYPSLLFNSMINPLIPYGIRGVLWYQGEANADRAYQYRTSFPLMISDWRQHWGEGNFPFYFVQLASFNSANGNSELGSTWGELREAQMRTLSLPGTGMAVTTDIGESNDIHPKNKQDVGKRLAAIALNNIYGFTMEYSGPVFESMTIQENKIILSYTHTGSGLMVKDKYGYIKGFEIAGSDHHFHNAKAYIQNNRVIVYADEVTVPETVHYAWADDAGDANLFNQEGFPAVPFRTDRWKGLTDNIKFTIAH